MKKKIAAVTDAMYWIPCKNLPLRGSGYYIYNFLLSLAINNEITVFYTNKIVSETPQLNNIKFIEMNELPSVEDLEKENFDFVWNLCPERTFKSNKFLSFDVQHAHSALYRQQYVRSPLENFIKKIFTPKRYYDKVSGEKYKETFNRTDILFSNSSIARNDYVNLCGLKKENVPIIYPIVPENYGKLTETKQHKPFTFGISAVTFDLKGGYIMLNAIVKMLKKRKDFKVKFIYPGYKKNYYLQFLVKLNGLTSYCEFFDYQSDMNDFYDNCDCIVIPSKEETFGCIAIEAMAKGLPVVVSDKCGCRDIIQNGINGFIYNSNEKNLADNLLKILEKDNLKIIGENARKTALQNTIEEHSKKLNKILDGYLIKKG